MYPRVYKEIAPHKHLHQYIKCYWMYEKDYDGGDFEHVFPDSSYELIYARDATFTVEGELVPRLFIVGQLPKPVDFAAADLVRLWAVRFYPWGLTPLGNIEKLAGYAWTSAGTMFGKRTAQDLTKLFQNVTEATLADTLNNYFLRILLGWQFSHSFLQQATQKLLAEKGNIKVQDLAEYCYISQRQLERGLKEVTDKSPREIAGRLRFEQARDAIMHNPDIPMAFLAQEYGYADQSHLNNDFKKYTDMTPTAYADVFRRAQPQMRNHDNVVFLQDTDS